MSDSDNAASDIFPRSAWEDDRGARVTIVVTAAGYVRFVDADGVPRTLHHATFRKQHEPLFDRRQVRSQFSMSCANLSEFIAYWNPAKRRMLTRSVICSRRFALPAGVVQIGIYASPCNPEEFLDDLDCLLAANEYAARTAASASA